MCSLNFDQDAQIASQNNNAINEVYAGLLALHQKTDLFFDAVYAAHRERMRCAPGCADCCHRMPHVFPVEAWGMARGLLKQTNVPDRLLKKIECFADVDDVRPCAFLDSRGSCLCYGLRPIICRSHGSPIKVPGQTRQGFDTCPLNFSTPQQRQRVQNSDILDVERLNQILSVVDSLFRQAHPNGQSLPLRVPLAQGVLYFLKLERSTL